MQTLDEAPTVVLPAVEPARRTYGLRAAGGRAFLTANVLFIAAAGTWLHYAWGLL